MIFSQEYQVSLQQFKISGFNETKVNKNLNFFVRKCGNFKIRIHNFWKCWILIIIN